MRYRIVCKGGKFYPEVKPFFFWKSIITRKTVSASGYTTTHVDVDSEDLARKVIRKFKGKTNREYHRKRVERKEVIINV